VRLVGSVPELGAWDPAKAVRLKKTPENSSVWWTPEVLLPSQTAAALEYKYAKVSSANGAFAADDELCTGDAPQPVVQWEAGDNRMLELSCLSDIRLNCVKDGEFDVDVAEKERDSVFRIKFKESALSSACLEKSELTSLQTSRLASTVATPICASVGQTPVQASSRVLQELQQVLRELEELETFPLAGRVEVRLASTAVRAAIEKERSAGGRRARRSKGCRSLSCVTVSLMMVPLLPAIVATAILFRVPSARTRGMELLGGAAGLIDPFGYAPGCSGPAPSFTRSSSRGRSRRLPWRYG